MQITQIQLTEEQASALKQLAAKEGEPVAELIRTSVDALLRSTGFVSRKELRRRAITAEGKLREGPEDLSTDHERYLREGVGS
ncbi:MAG: hypothetical protein A2Z16_11805 [Chloroflexi bacterium RBG_16_54_18]|nr:MAG: hypothetical protein A2Z16_11805 [Chloroflexi bacterium RBG_16_54_18]HLE51579.1 hypothetical protein [Anaerolineales bacterium]